MVLYDLRNRLHRLATLHIEAKQWPLRALDLLESCSTEQKGVTKNIVARTIEGYGRVRSGGR